MYTYNVYRKSSSIKSLTNLEQYFSVQTPLLLSLILKKSKKSDEYLAVTCRTNLLKITLNQTKTLPIFL